MPSSAHGIDGEPRRSWSVRRGVLSPSLRLQWPSITAHWPLFSRHLPLATRHLAARAAIRPQRVLEEPAAEPEQGHGGNDHQNDHVGVEHPDHHVGRDEDRIGSCCSWSRRVKLPAIWPCRFSVLSATARTPCSTFTTSWLSMPCRGPRRTRSCDRSFASDTRKRRRPNRLRIRWIKNPHGLILLLRPCLR